MLSVAYMLKKVSVKYIFCYLFVLNFTLLGQTIEKIDVDSKKKLLKLSVLDFYNFTSYAHYEYLSPTLLEGVTKKFDKIFNYQKVSVNKEGDQLKNNVVEFIKKSGGSKIQVYNQYLEDAIKSFAEVNNIDIIIFGYYTLQSSDAITIITEVYSRQLDSFYKLDITNNPIDATLFSVASDVAGESVYSIKLMFHLSNGNDVSPIILFSLVAPDEEIKYKIISQEIYKLGKYIVGHTNLFLLSLNDFYVYIKKNQINIDVETISAENIESVSKQCTTCTFIVYNYQHNQSEIVIYNNGKKTLDSYKIGNSSQYKIIVQKLRLGNKNKEDNLVLDESILSKTITQVVIDEPAEKKTPLIERANPVTPYSSHSNWSNIYYENSISVNTSGNLITNSKYLGYSVIFVNRFIICNLLSPQNKAQKILKNMHVGVSLGGLFVPSINYNYLDANTLTSIQTSGYIFSGVLKFNYGYRFLVRNWRFLLEVDYLGYYVGYLSLSKKEEGTNIIKTIIYNPTFTFRFDVAYLFDNGLTLNTGASYQYYLDSNVLWHNIGWEIGVGVALRRKNEN